jgi:tyrosinase
MPDDEPTGGAPPATAAPALDPWAGPDVYLSHYLPFQPFPTPEALARALVDTEGRLWSLDPGSGATPVPAPSHEHPPQLPASMPAPPGGAPAGVPSASPEPAIPSAAAGGRFGWSATVRAQPLPDVRRNVYELTRREWRRFVDALVRAKAGGAYDPFVVEHLLAMGFAHRSPTFGPWHRWYLRRFERMLQSFDPGVTLPYWDWAADALLADPAAAPLWTSQYLGGDGDPGNGDRVPDGPFADWSSSIPTARGSAPTVERPGIIRALGRAEGKTWTLPGPADVDAAMASDVYDVAPYDTTSPSGFRNALEGWAPVVFGGAPGLHNQVHLWVGGDMVAATSPNDPAFWLHHANVDRLWVRWQRRFPDAGYEPRSDGPPGMNLYDPIAWVDEPGGPTINPAGTLDPLLLGYAYEE